MLDFIYNTPTKVYFGKDKEREIGKIISSYGYKKIMLQYGQNSIKKSGLYDRVMNSLRDSQIEVVEMSGVEPNPKLSFVYRAIEVAKKEKVELILAVGGGSVLDSCKYTALGALTDDDVWDYAMGKKTPTVALPVGVILTHSAAGSEMSSSAVITNSEKGIKKGVGTELNRCLFAVMNPELTYTVSKYQTACGIVDIMAHTMERYFTPVPETPLTDEIAEGILRSVISAGKIVMQNPEDYDSRADIMWASSLSHNGLTGAGRQNYLAVHQLEHAVSGMYDSVAHGAGLAVLFPAWAKYVYKFDTKRFSRFARKVWGVEEIDDTKASLLGIERMSAFFTELGMPSKLSDFGVKVSDSDYLAKLTTFDKTKTVTSTITLTFDEIKEIFESCM